MKSATSCFNRGMFLKSVLRFWPIWAIYTFVQLLALPLNLISPLSAGAHDALSRNVLDTIYLAEFVCPLAACASAMAVFSHLYSERSAGFFAALPVRRRRYVPVAGGRGTAAAAGGKHRHLPISLAVGGACSASPSRGALLQWLGAVTPADRGVFRHRRLLRAADGAHRGHARAVHRLRRCRQLAGQHGACRAGHVLLRLSGPAATGVTDLFSPFVCLSARSHVQPRRRRVRRKRLELSARLRRARRTAAARLVALYKRRDMESAGDVVAIAPLRPVFQLICSLAAAFLLGNLFYTLPFGSSPADGSAQAVVYALCMSAAAFIGWFCAAMLVNKSFCRVQIRPALSWLGRRQPAVRRAGVLLRAGRDRLRDARAGSGEVQQRTRQRRRRGRGLRRARKYRRGHSRALERGRRPRGKRGRAGRGWHTPGCSCAWTTAWTAGASSAASISSPRTAGPTRLTCCRS